MAATNINIRTDSELKAKAQSVLSDLGLDMSTAINIFLNQIVYTQAIPFIIEKPKALKPQRPRSALRGCLKGKVWMADDFDAPIEDMQEYMEGF